MGDFGSTLPLRSMFWLVKILDFGLGAELSLGGNVAARFLVQALAVELATG